MPDPVQAPVEERLTAVASHFTARDSYAAASLVSEAAAELTRLRSAIGKLCVDGAAATARAQSAEARLIEAEREVANWQEIARDRQGYAARVDARLAKVTEALDLALERLGRLEPGDSRAVSEEYVAMAAVQAGIANDEHMAIIRQALSETRDEKAPEAAGCCCHFGKAETAAEAQIAELVEIVRQMCVEYDADEQCDRFKINALIERAGALIGRYTPIAAPPKAEDAAPSSPEQAEETGEPA